MSYKIRKRLSRIFIGIGLCIIAVVLVVNLSAYPWRLLLSELGLAALQTAEELPEPKPLPSEQVSDALPIASGEGTMEDVQLDDVAVARTESGVPLIQLGTIKIPKISLSENIVSGTGEEMYYGVGHLTTSALPGEAGNCVLAAHRNLIVAHAFRYLDKLSEGDQVTINYGDDTVTYTVYSVFTVNPDEGWVLELQPDETHMLTLITCTPALNPTHRLIVWARLDGV
ncbi:MAG: class D sortase [Oscillospiraceae bacterium]|nr:class D sortase [Oscillospiraceae bacterium]